MWVEPFVARLENGSDRDQRGFQKRKKEEPPEPVAITLRASEQESS